MKSFSSLGLVVQVVRSALFALFFYAGSALIVCIAALATLFFPHSIQSITHGWGRYHRWCCEVLLGQRIVVEGAIPAEPMLVIVKHESMFETIDMLCLLRNPAIAAKQELLDMPGWGAMARLYGLLGIEREAGAQALRKLQREAASRVADGRPVVLFPEGTRVPHGVRAPIRSGFAALYQLLKLPVLPIAVDSGRLSPRGKFLKRSGTITYRIGAVIPQGLPRDEAEARTLEAINALNPPAGDGHSPTA